LVQSSCYLFKVETSHFHLKLNVKQQRLTSLRIEPEYNTLVERYLAKPNLFRVVGYKKRSICPAVRKGLGLKIDEYFPVSAWTCGFHLASEW